MKTRKSFNKIIPLVALLSLLGMASCSKGSTAKKDSNIDYWTCTMHPSVHSKDPGKCPICSMDLVPVLKKGGGEAKPTPACSKSRSVARACRVERKARSSFQTRTRSTRRRYRRSARMGGAGVWLNS